MSDTPQGPGWWQASDGRWYPPDQFPGAQAPAPAWPAMAGQPGGGAVPIGAALDVGSGMSWAWAKLKQHAGTLAALAVLPMVVFLGVALLGIFALAPAGTSDAGSALSVLLLLLVALVGIVISFVMSRGLYRAALAVCDGRPPEVGMLFQLDGIGPFIVVSLLYGLAVMVGAILCIIPGIIASVVFVWAPYAVVDQGLSPTQAMRRSWELTKARPGEVLLYLLVVYAVSSLISTVCFILGLATVPWMWLAMAYAWRRMNGLAVAP